MCGFSTERRFRLFVSGAILNIWGESYRLKGKRQAGLFPSLQQLLPAPEETGRQSQD